MIFSGFPNSTSRLDNIRWLLDSDPSIRWQVMRDLMNSPGEIWKTERSRVAEEGWGKHLLDRQDEKGIWSGGLYSP